MISLTKTLGIKRTNAATKEIRIPIVGLLFFQPHDIPPKNAQMIAISPIK